MRCEGWRRKGGAFTFGPVVWKQCSNEASVMLTVLQKPKGEKKKIRQVLPACPTCWQECIDTGIEIEKAAPIIKKKGGETDGNSKEVQGKSQ